MTLSPLVSRIAALALLLLVSWLIWTVFAAPLIGGLAEDRQSIARSEQLLARYDQVEAMVPELQQRLKTLRADQAGMDAFIQGANPALMTAKLQASAQQITAAADVQLRSSRTLPLAAEGNFSRLGLELELTASAGGLQHLLYDLESAKPMIFVDRLSISVPEGGTTAKAPDGQSALNISIRVLSYAQATRTAP